MFCFTQAWSPATVDFFYKSELATAVKQIRQDFSTLNDQQLSDYKRLKEDELATAVRLATEEKVFADEMKSQRDRSREIDTQNVHAELDVNVKEMRNLQASYGEKMSKLAELERRFSELKSKMIQSWDDQQSEIDALKQENATLLGEVDYWDRHARAKLENEIQTYRSILSCLMSSESTVVCATSTVNSASSDTIDMLRSIFNYFDWSRDGTIHSSEFENIMRKLNVKLSDDAYNQVFRDFDKEGTFLFVF